MKKFASLLMIALMLLGCLCAQGCSSEDGALKDGYYSAEMSDYSHGWKEYITICVRGEKIVSAEYNARNASGFIKSWDMDYMRNMDAINGTYPNRYTRTYAGAFLENQGVDGVDAIAGASTSYGTFKQLAQAVVERSMAGDTSVAVVPAAAE